MPSISTVSGHLQLIS